MKINSFLNEDMSLARQNSQFPLFQQMKIRQYDILMALGTSDKLSVTSPKSWRAGS